MQIIFVYLLRKNPNHKYQIPNKFKIQNPNDRKPANLPLLRQSPCFEFVFWVIGYCLLFEICYLEFHRCRIKVPDIKSTIELRKVVI